MQLATCILKGWQNDQKGVALTEFAIALPFLLLLFFGGLQLCQAAFAYRKLTLTARTLADLTSQNASVTDRDLEEILAAGKEMMAPYDPSPLQARISQVSVDGRGNAIVDWSAGLKMAAYQKGSSFVAIADKWKTPESSVIVAEVVYTYLPLGMPSAIGPMPLREEVIMFPRVSTVIAKD